jgi:hypothetical protein
MTKKTIAILYILKAKQAIDLICEVKKKNTTATEQLNQRKIEIVW